ncbi:MAG: proline dehydrogenase family protein [Burkholderiales bacterium]|nr:proline dehydrogenase family protein [Burkholderiales bacterium]
MEKPPRPDPARARVTAYYAADEAALVRTLAERAALAAHERESVSAHAAELIARVRARSEHRGAVESLLQEYDLSSEEGVLLMCVAEALLRIPDAPTADRLIAAKLADADWSAHLGHSDSLAVNASTFGLMLTGRLVALAVETRRDPWGGFKRLVARVGEPVIRVALRHAMRILGQQFVMGRTIEEALARSRAGEHRRYRHSFDMLGEAALCAADARRYFDAYRRAICAIGAEGPWPDPESAPSVSVKLSALHPALRARQARAGDGGTRPCASCACDARARSGDRAHGGCRGSGAPGAVARRAGGGGARSSRSPVGTGSGLRYRPIRSGPFR